MVDPVAVADGSVVVFDGSSSLAAGSEGSGWFGVTGGVSDADVDVDVDVDDDVDDDVESPADEVVGAGSGDVDDASDAPGATAG